MAQAANVVGLLRDSDQAGRAVQELGSHGFNRDSIDLITSTDGNPTNRITQLGAPQQEAQFYAQGIQGGGTLVTVRTTEDRAEEAMDILDRIGAMHFDPGMTQNTTATSAAMGRGTTEGDVAIPIVEEQLQIGKRAVERGGVRVYSRVEERPVEEQVRLREEEVHVERHPVNREVTDADRAAFKEGVIEITETDEEAVVAKQARVVEEVVVGKEVSERTETVRDTVRRTDVNVEEIDADDSDALNTPSTTGTTRTTTP